MNRTLKMQSKIDMQEVRPRPFFIPDSKTEMNNHNKNINKLIFYESDEEHSSQDDNTHHKLYMTSREMTKDTTCSRGKRQGKEQFKAETLMLRPSMMKFSLEADGDYYDFAQNNQKKNTAKQNNYVASTATNTATNTVKKD